MSPLYFPTCQFLSRRAPILTTYILPPNVGYNLPIKKRIPAPKRGYPLIIITVFPPSLRTLFHWLYTALWSLKALMDLGDGVRGSFGDTILREMNHEPRPRGSQYFGKEFLKSRILWSSKEFLGWSLLQYFAVGYEDDAVGNFSCEAHLMRHNYHGHTTVGQILHQI